MAKLERLHAKTPAFQNLCYLAFYAIRQLSESVVIYWFPFIAVTLKTAATAEPPPILKTTQCSDSWAVMTAP